MDFTRKSHVLMSRIRCRNSDLNNNLFSRNLSESMLCDVCNVPETVEHFLLFCTAFNDMRCNITDNIPIESWNVESILYASKRYNQELNNKIQMWHKNSFVILRDLPKNIEIFLF